MPPYGPEWTVIRTVSAFSMGIFAGLVTHYVGKCSGFGKNDLFIEGLYEDYLANPASVPAEWRAYFDSLPPAPGAAHDVAHSGAQLD